MDTQVIMVNTLAMTIQLSTSVQISEDLLKFEEAFGKFLRVTILSANKHL